MSVYVQDSDFTLWHGDALDVLHALDDNSADCVVTSPPYADARADVPGVDPGLWPTIFNELARVVTGGMLWNVGRIWRDGIERMWWTDLIQAASFSGWQHWDTAVWVKPNANPIHGRILANSHEYVLVFGRDGVRFNEDTWRRPYPESTLARYRRGFKANAGVKGYDRPLHRRSRSLDADAAGARGRSFVIAHTGREKGNSHPTPMCEEVAESLVSLASWPGGTVLDPFGGSGTTALVARRLGRRSIGIELSSDYCALAAKRLSQQSLLAGDAA